MEVIEQQYSLNLLELIKNSIQSKLLNFQADIESNPKDFLDELDSNAFTFDGVSDDFENSKKFRESLYLSLFGNVKRNGKTGEIEKIL